MKNILKSEDGHMKTSKETEYFILLLEQYAAFHQKSGKEILDLFNQHDLIPYIYRMYNLYHIEDIHNAFEDLDERISLSKQC